MQIVQVDIDQIKPYWRNPRKNENAVKAVKQSIERYGFNVPIVLDSDGVIIAGHTRYKALLEMGEKSAPCVYSDMSPKKAKEFRIADNKLAELAHWDVDDLKLEMREFDIIGALPGFSDDEMRSLMKDVNFNIPSSGNIIPIEDQLPTAPMGVVGSLVSQANKEASKFDQKQDELDTRFSNRSQEDQSSYVQVTCPHCGGEFILDRRQMEH